MGRPHTTEVEKKFKKKLDNRIETCYIDNMKQNTQSQTLEIICVIPRSSRTHKLFSLFYLTNRYKLVTLLTIDTKSIS